ncbi:hypothetical protein ACFRCG_41695 [Embleya sp. NPDC056575]|uniref:hypothetical protein n=1 Tax=unclassified Embleya TaxID=2699296 RepID=UPI0036A7C15F
MTDPTAADQWNALHPVGTPVHAWPAHRDTEPVTTRTRTAAWTLGHGTAVVSVEGYAGGISLGHIEPRNAPPAGHGRTADGVHLLDLVSQLSPETRARIAQRLDDRFHEITGTPRDPA